MLRKKTVLGKNQEWNYKEARIKEKKANLRSM